MHTPTPYYRNASCKAIAEQVARSEAEQTLDVNINIDDLLRKSKAVIGEQVVNAIHSDLPFVLFGDQKNYYLVVPASKLVVCVVNDIERARTVSPTDKAFANNVKLAIAAYDNFMILPQQIEPPAEVLQITSHTDEPQDIVIIK